MNETDTTQIQFPLPGQRRRLVFAAIAATLILSTVVAVGRGTNGHRATPPTRAREAVAEAAAAPMVALYILSIGVAWMVHPAQRRARQARKGQ